MSRVSRLSWALLILFVLSGFAGLIYQSVWSHYLGLTLGHAAYAQTLVLAIFMGGMALGAWLASRYSLRWKRLILGYAAVEGVIGLLGLLFHPAFVGYTGFSQETVLPALGSASLAHGYQWITAALLITPQSILLGATFPLMSAGLIRALPQEQGQVLGGLYFTNSLGAALGALLATFLLLPAVGLPGTAMTAGLLNIVVAVGAWALSKVLEDEAGEPPPAARAVQEPVDRQELQRLGRILLAATAISGAASFVYEVGWVRLLNLAFGTTIHSFELMLAAFILGLAFGGLWIRKRASSIAEPVRYVGYVQVLMGIAALLSVPVFTQSFGWVGWLMGALSRSPDGYTLFELGTAAIALLVMFPAAFFAGMTLPLFTLALLRAGADERVIGRIYAANTLGAIAGVAVAVHVLIPLMGVRLAVTLAALADGLLGLYLLRAVNPARFTRGVGLAAAGLAGIAVFAMIAGRPDPLEQVSGVFRTGRARLENAVVEYLRDGKTATVGVVSAGNTRAISTNGKPDAGLTPLDQAPSGDEITMVMAGVLPVVHHPNPQRVAVIGWGSGLTTHTLLGSQAPRVVDTVEIERAMVDGARLFGERVERAYRDPRSQIHIDDARTFFSTGARQYDVIVSEPSNPWVSGVASLFTREFYAFLKRHLSDGGVLVQWLHSYELNDALVGTMLAALVVEFPEVDVYITNDVDLLLVARAQRGPLQMHRSPAAPGSVLEAELRRVAASRPEELRLRWIGGTEVLLAWLRMSGAQAHSDYFPTVSLQAPKARFMGQRSSFMTNLVTNGMPVLDILACRRPLPLSEGMLEIPNNQFSLWRGMGAAIRDVAVNDPGSVRAYKLSPLSGNEIHAVMRLSSMPLESEDAFRQWTEGVAAVARGSLGHLDAADLEGLWIHPRWVAPENLARADVSDILAAYEAAASREPLRMRQAAEHVLARHGARVAPRMREQMLVIAMLGAIGSGDHSAIPELENRWGKDAGRTDELTPVRSYLLAWADGPVPACAARAAVRQTGR